MKFYYITFNTPEEARQISHALLKKTGLFQVDGVKIYYGKFR